MLGLLVATSAFTVLTAASKTSQLETVGTVTQNFVPAYEILVRPRGARTALENETNTVQPNFLSGIYGGITMTQYHQISQVPGVEVAAPIALVGYALLYSPITFTIPASYYKKPGPQAVQDQHDLDQRRRDEPRHPAPLLLVRNTQQACVRQHVRNDR